MFYHCFRQFYQFLVDFVLNLPILALSSQNLGILSTGQKIEGKFFMLKKNKILYKTSKCFLRIFVLSKIYQFFDLTILKSAK